MPSLPVALAAGLVGGLVASAAMNAYQSMSAPLFGQDKGNDDPATVKAADAAKKAVGADPVAQKNRAKAGNAVHYATGAAFGIGYGVLARKWPAMTIGFGTAFGLATALAFDNAAVPALGLGPAPQDTPPSAHAYGLSSHIMFGAALEGARRIAISGLGSVQSRA